jgi:hypothetical protein
MEENGLRVFHNKILRKICGPETDEVTGDCRRLPNEELYDLYSSPNITRVIKCDTVGERRGAHRAMEAKREKTNR